MGLKVIEKIAIQKPFLLVFTRYKPALSVALYSAVLSAVEMLPLGSVAVAAEPALEPTLEDGVRRVIR